MVTKEWAPEPESGDGLPRSPDGESPAAQKSWRGTDASASPSEQSFPRVRLAKASLVSADPFRTGSASLSTAHSGRGRR